MTKFFPTGKRYTRPAKKPGYLNGEHTIGPGTREVKMNHNTVVETGRNKNAMGDDRRTSVLTGTATEIANEAIARMPRTAKL